MIGEGFAYFRWRVLLWFKYPHDDRCSSCERSWRLEWEVDVMKVLP